LDRLVCVAFPRTASTYLTESLKVAYPNIEVAHIFHKIDVLRKEKNIITILRKPEDAIASWITKIDDNDIEGNLDWFNRFMIATIERKDSIYITEFDDVITDVNSVIEQYAKYYSFDKPALVDTDIVFKNMLLEYSDRLPSTSNKNLKDKIVKSKDYQKSLSLYEEAKAFATKDW
jgi:hypothetical protein